MEKVENHQKVVREIKAKHDIRHMLAIERTILANERTVLSYSRTSLTLILAGVSFLHFTEDVTMHILGWFFIPLGVIISFFGYQRFYTKRTAIRKEKEAVDQMLKNEYCNLPEY